MGGLGWRRSEGRGSVQKRGWRGWGLMDVGQVGGVVMAVGDAMVCEASFPDIQLAL